LQNAQYYLLACINSPDLFVQTDYPCFIINLIGTRISVCGALIMDKPTVSWLTPVVPLYSSDNQDISYLCRLFKSLKKGFGDLKAYYSSNSRKLTIPLPFIKEMDTTNGRVSWDYRYAVKLRSTKIMYKAYLHNGKLPVLVKFVQSYSYSAHTCMATAGFAPAIYGIVKVAKRWHLVIMEDLSTVEWKDIVTMRETKALTEEHKQCLQRAVRHLHNSGFVHGDLRPNNLLFHERAVKANMKMLFS
jgi:hypothetical protein